jgi:hypothetical protein
MKQLFPAIKPNKASLLHGVKPSKHKGDRVQPNQLFQSKFRASIKGFLSDVTVDLSAGDKKLRRKETKEFARRIQSFGDSERVSDQPKKESIKRMQRSLFGSKSPSTLNSDSQSSGTGDSQCN